MSHSLPKKSPVFVASALAVGMSTLLLGVAPASAAPTCSNGAVLVSSNVCELRVTTVGPTTITPTPEMSQLEALLVGGGGTGAPSTGYGSGGGGGEVTLVGFGSDSSTPVTVDVGGAGAPSTVTQGTVTATARGGHHGGYVGGLSGNLHGPFDGTLSSSGGGAGGSAPNTVDGGPGVVVSSIAPAGSLFSDVSECYGGGGASLISGVYGVAVCGGGAPIDSGSGVVAVPAVANSGGGGSGAPTTATGHSGASGVVVLRWVALVEVTVSFDLNGRGAAIPTQTFLEGSVATRPADPTAEGYQFNGWFADAALTVPADFSAPITASTTFYASWSPVLAETGGAASVPLIGFALGALGAGMALLGVHRRSARRV